MSILILSSHYELALIWGWDGNQIFLTFYCFYHDPLVYKTGRLSLEIHDRLIFHATEHTLTIKLKLLSDGHNKFISLDSWTKQNDADFLVDILGH